MTLFPELEASPLRQVCVALDLETTGLAPETDEIIEVGAVKFQGDQVLDTFSALVNPHRALPPFIQRLTGITQAVVDVAQPFGGVSPGLTAFVGDAPLVGHNIAFDLGFLARRGLRFTAPTFDTWDLASLLLPQAERSLAALVATLGVPHSQAHRALADAQATHRVLMALLERALALAPEVLGELHRLAGVARWPLCYLLRGLEEEALRRSGGSPSRLGVGGLDLEALRTRLHPSRLRGRRQPRGEPLEEEELAALLGAQGPLASVLPEYGPRQEQEAMLRAVTLALQKGHNLLVEAGTGVGKSVAYLLPAALSAVRSGKKVVVSTNTINLQEQLIAKDIPAVVAALERAGEVEVGELRATTLKGRANYLCMRRWARLRSTAGMSVDEARLHGKLLLWLQETETGDRAELSLGGPENALWDRLSAQGSTECPVSGGGPCCLQAARERASAAHLVVVNHALLLSDLQRGGGLLPDYDLLVIDEAHHLEEEATRQFGFRVNNEVLTEALDALAGPRGLATEAIGAYRGATVTPQRRQGTEAAAQSMTDAVQRVRDQLHGLFGDLGRFLKEHAQGGDGQRSQLLVTAAVRAQPDWSGLEVAGEELRAAVGEVGRGLQEVHRSLDGLEGAKLLSYDELRNELVARTDALGEVQDRLAQFFLRPDDKTTIYWVESAGGSGLTLCAAPLHVGPLLQERLFDKKQSVVLTSATLSTGASFAAIRERLGLEEAQELLLGSPFDYARAAMVCLPQDMPEPGVAAYGEALSAAVAGLARAAGGRTMALFTSHASLRAARTGVQRLLDGEEIRVMAQGVDGAPKRLLEEFLKDPRAVLLGTASFWEGVDLAGEALQVLVLARLPFDVPTEPVFAARSQRYEEPFREYALPQAILRFRQGFGRLIRTQQDRGVVVVLDRRISSRSYGELFLRSLPPCTVERPRLEELPELATSWLRR